MAFVINKIGPLYSGILPDLGVGDFINNSVSSITGGLFGKSEPENTSVNLKVDSLKNVLKGEEQNAVVLEEYVPPPQKKSAFKQSSKNILNQDFSNLGGGRFFVFVEYRDDTQALRGMRGYGNMILSTRGPLKFNGQQNLPDMPLPGAGNVVMDMGPGDSYINFEGSFLFQTPDESIAWLENARLNGRPFIFHYKRWHRFVRIQRLGYDIINNNHIDFSIGLKVMGFDDKDINNIITSGKQKTRLERLAVAETASRMQAAAADAVAGVLGLNDIEDVATEFVDQWDRISGFSVAAKEGFANSGAVYSDYISAKSDSLSVATKVNQIHGNMSADINKYVSSTNETNEFLKSGVTIAKGLL